MGKFIKTTACYMPYVLQSSLSLIFVLQNLIYKVEVFKKQILYFLQHQSEPHDHQQFSQQTSTRSRSYQKNQADRVTMNRRNSLTKRQNIMNKRNSNFKFSIQNRFTSSKYQKNTVCIFSWFEEAFMEGFLDFFENCLN